MCPTIGASAHECSTFNPIFPFGYEIKVKDLSNHLWQKDKGRKTAESLTKPTAETLPATSLPYLS